MNGWGDRFRAANAAERAARHGLAVAMAVYLCLFGLYSQWYIEDAAIVFAFARNAGNGLGFVPWPGGERVEGFSDPLWTLVLTALSAVRVSPWIAAKILGAGLGLATLAGVDRWARALHPQGDPRIGAAAAALVAISPQFAAWNASGLENPLLGWLLVWGAVAVAEGRPGLVVGTWWGLVAITRPEGLMYGAIAGAVGGAAAGRQAPRWIAGFGAGLVLPIAGWMAFKVPYFAWPLPNTYYAKLGDVAPGLAVWDGDGWNYLRNWGLRTGQGFLLPLYAVGLAGPSGWRPRLAAALALLAMLSWVPGLAWTDEIPGWPLRDGPVLVAARLALTALALGGLPLLALGRPGSAARALAAWIAAAGLFFSVAAAGDWMTGFRWMAIPAVALGVLLADALVVWVPRLPVGARAVLAVGVGGVLFGAGGAETVRYVRGADTSPFDVQDRLAFHARIARKLALDLPPRVGDVDMGAHLWWYRSPVLDYAGLLDVPFAQHHYDPRFLDEYVFAEIRPEIVHVHGNWSARSRLRSRPGFSSYVNVGGYAQSGGIRHDGSVVRRELLTGTWTGPAGRGAVFGAQVGAAELLGWEVPDAVAPGGPLPIRTAWRKQGVTHDFSVYAFLADSQGVRVVWELPPGWGWLPAERWRTGEVLVTRHLPTVPADLPPGNYDLGIAVFGKQDGAGWPADPAAAAAVFARGEIRWPGGVVVAAAAAVEAAVQSGLVEAERRADQGDCDGAISVRRATRDRLPFEPPEVEALRVPIGRCLARRATPAAMAAAMRWAAADPEVRATGVALADHWEAEGRAALAGGDPAAAHASWRAALDADPLRPWLRRALEGLRRERLGLDRPRRSPGPVERVDPNQRGG